MKSSCKRLCRVWLFFYVMIGPVVLSAATEPVLKSIFNGRDLGGWYVGNQEPSSNPNWRVEAGMIVGESGDELRGSTLRTEKTYGDFVLELETRWTGPEIDTGVIIRNPQIQLQMGVSRSMKRDMTGSWCLSPEYPIRYPESGQAKDWEKYLKKGDWNTFRIEARGTTFTVWINSHQVSQYSNPKFAQPGPIRLQFHGGLKMKLEFRNIRLAEL